MIDNCGLYYTIIVTLIKTKTIVRDVGEIKTYVKQITKENTYVIAYSYNTRAYTT